MDTGLSTREAADRLARHGLNELPQPKPPSLARRILRHLADPLSILLLIAGAVTLLVLHAVPEGVAIVTILLVNVVIGVSQELKAEQAVRALRSLTAPMANLGLSQRISLGLIVHIRKVPLSWRDGACRESCPHQIRRHFPSEDYRFARQDQRIR
jgi:Ca2+-transporting ATPase